MSRRGFSSGKAIDPIEKYYPGQTLQSCSYQFSASTCTHPHSDVFILAIQGNMFSSNMHRANWKKLCSETGLEQIGLFNHVVHGPDGHC